MTTASAPGKVILFGEHAVVYGRPALAAPVTQVLATAKVSDADASGIQIDAPDVGIAARLDDLPGDHPLARAVRLTLDAIPSLASPPGLRLAVRSTIPVAAGLGSGAAVAVAVIRALSAHLGHPLADERVSALAFEVEKLHHGTPSGIDNTVITYARPVYFVKDRPLEIFRAAAPFTIVIADTGKPGLTRESVGDLRTLWQAEPARWERVFDRVGEIVVQARIAIESGETSALGPLMDANHALLQEMTVSSPELDALVAAARSAGALGAKMSGGGRGGNMIALVAPGTARSVADALIRAGACGTILTKIG